MKDKIKKTACVCLSAAVLFAATACGGDDAGTSGGGNSAGGGNSSGSESTIDRLPNDDRYLTPQEYSIANLTAIDDYGRTVTVKDPNNESKKYLGMFYFAWLGSQGSSGVYDVTKLERENPTALYDPTNTTNSPAWQFHFNSEPLFGYYSMKDPWVITRHIEMITFAGVDYVLFDFTNAVTYNDVVQLFLETAKKFKEQGWNVPKVGFYTNSYSLNTVNNVYNRFYAGGQYDDMWFRFEGDDRPVIVGVSTANGGATDQGDSSQFISTDSELYKYFNFYESQWPSSANKNQQKGLPWMQWGEPVPNENGFISVSVAQHSAQSVFFSDQLNNSSRGYNGVGGKESDWKRGANFEWQWNTAFAYDKAGAVKNIFVTGWNEWTAIKYPSGKYHTESNKWAGIPNGASGYTGKEVWFVDDYNAEYSREVEPGKEYGDGFYIQLAANGRQFKMSDAKKYNMKKKTISDLSDFSAWKNVFVEYADFAGDAIARDGENAANVPHSYVDNSNRNDIKTIKVAHNDEYLYFYVETADDITEYNGTDSNWMNILISAGNTDTSFAGFNYIVNRSVRNGKTSIEKCNAKGFNWTKSGEGEIAVSGNKMAVKIPLSTLGLTADNVEISFKVCDNVQKPDDILDYYVTGDCAPIGRFGYAYGK